MITYVVKNGKYIFCKDGVYFSISLDQVKELFEVCKAIIAEEGVG